MWPLLRFGAHGDIHGSWLMTGKSLVSIAPLIGKFFVDIAGGGGGAAAAAGVQVTTVVPLKFGVSALTNSDQICLLEIRRANTDYQKCVL